MEVFKDVLILVLITSVSIFIYFKWKYLYWWRKGVPFLKPRIPFGTSENPFNRKNCSAIAYQNYYKYFKSLGHKYGGLYGLLRPTFLVTDLGLIKCVLSKDFQYFTDRGMYHNETDDPLSGHLFNLEGQKWKKLRAKLTPTFTSGKMKSVFPIIVACSDPLYTVLSGYNSTEEPADIKDVLTRFTTDVIGSCAFGIECNSFKEPDNEFRRYCRMFFTTTSKLQALKFLIAFANPQLGKRLRLQINDPNSTKFFLNVVKKTIAFRENNNVKRNDFMQLLMDVKDEDGAKLTIEEITAQAFVFFVAGFETSSTTMAFCLYELAINQEIQNRVRNEIYDILAKHGGDVTYEGVMAMKYLDQVIKETLRKYSPVSAIPRICVQDYRIPGTDIIIEENTRVLIPVYGIHHDPEYYPDPEKFDPERFNDINKANINPFSYMPFGEGPRICIGLRFGMLQAKVGLVKLLKHFKFLYNVKTKVPLQFSTTQTVLNAEGGIWLDIKKIS